MASTLTAQRLCVYPRRNTSSKVSTQLVPARHFQGIGGRTVERYAVCVRHGLHPFAFKVLPNHAGIRRSGRHAISARRVTRRSMAYSQPDGSPARLRDDTLPQADCFFQIVGNEEDGFLVSAQSARNRFPISSRFWMSSALRFSTSRSSGQVARICASHTFSCRRKAGGTLDVGAKANALYHRARFSSLCVSDSREQQPNGLLSIALST